MEDHVTIDPINLITGCQVMWQTVGSNNFSHWKFQHSAGKNNGYKKQIMYQKVTSYSINKDIIFFLIFIFRKEKAYLVKWFIIF